MKLSQSNVLLVSLAILSMASANSVETYPSEEVAPANEAVYGQEVVAADTQPEDCAEDEVVQSQNDQAPYVDDDDDCEDPVEEEVEAENEDDCEDDYEYDDCEDEYEEDYDEDVDNSETGGDEQDSGDSGNSDGSEGGDFGFGAEDTGLADPENVEISSDATKLVSTAMALTAAFLCL